MEQNRNILNELGLDQEKKRKLLEWMLKKMGTQMPVKDIAIIGISGRYPKSETLTAFWENLAKGVNCVSEVPEDRWNGEALRGMGVSKWGGFIKDVDKFDSLFFSISPNEASGMDPQERLFLETAWSVLEDSGYTRKMVSGIDRKVGVFVGVMNCNYEYIGAESITKGVITQAHSSYWSIANRVSYCFNFQGPSFAIDTACSSSLTAIHLACESLKRGECRIAIAGGVNLILHPKHFIGLTMMNMLSKDGKCRSFGLGADGFVDGEGVGAVLLKPLDKAMLDKDNIYAVIKGSSINSGGKTSGYTVPNPNAQADLIIESLKNANMDPRTISYIEAHGTGTSLGDPVEVVGLAKAFSQYTTDKQFCAIGSVKSNIGHLESAAGVAGLTKVILQLQHKKLVPSINSEELNPKIKFEGSPFFVQRELIDWEQPVIKENDIEKKYPRRAGLSSFGAGGANAHIIIEEYETPGQSHHVETDADTPCVVLLSARNNSRLKVYAEQMLTYITQLDFSSSQTPRLSDIAYTLQTGREAMKERMALVVSNIDELIDKLTLFCKGKTEIEGLYQGRIKKKKDYKELVDIGDESIETLIDTGQYEKLIQLWVSGLEIDWNLLYEDCKPRRIQLPTYPFQKVRHWVPDPIPVKDTVSIDNNSTSKLHPLIDVNRSTLKEEKFTTEFKGTEFFLSDHMVNGRKILPGVVYIEMARAAGEIAGEAKVHKIRNIVWTSPISVTNGGRSVDICLSADQDDINYVVRSENGKDRKVSHSQGKLVYNVENQSRFEPIDIELIKSRCSDTIDIDGYYNLFKAAGIEYGPGFKPIRALNYNTTEALACLELPSVCKDDFNQFVLHPSLMDGALQTVMGLIVGSGEGDGLYLPYAIGEVEVLNSLPANCYAYVTNAEKSSSSSTSVKKFDIHLLDSEGRVLVGMKDFSLRPVQPLTAKKAPKKTDISGTLYFTNKWEEAKFDTTIQDSDCIVLFDVNTDFYNSLKSKYSHNEDVDIILVKPGQDYKDGGDHVYTINPNNREDYEQLVSSLALKDIFATRIIHNWSHMNSSCDTEDLGAHFIYGYYSVFYLSQALMAQKPKHGVQLLYIYKYINNLPPQNAALSGFARTIGLENRKFIYKTIAMDVVTSDEAVDLILKEFQSEDGIEIRYKEGHRYVNRLKEVAIESETPSIPIKEDGVYLITGGAGGLGLLFAEYFVKQANINLVLTGRSDLSVEKASRIKELESSGSKVIYIKSDISRRTDVEELLSQIKIRFNIIDGIIHSAGLHKDGYIPKKTREEVDAVLAPKIYGTLHLDEFSKEDNLDFFVMFSSMASVIGNAGQSDYAYANRFIDNFSEIREKRRAEGTRTGKTLSINWPLWKEGGMGVDPETEKFMQKTMGMSSLDKREGIHAFLKGISFSDPQLMVVAGDVNKLRLALGFLETSMLMGISNGKVKAKSQSKPTTGDHTGNADEEGNLNKVQEDFIKIVCGILGVQEEDIDLDEDIQEYGFDSISLTEFSNRINEKYNIMITPAIFFELDYPSIGSFSEYLWQDYKDSFIQYYTDGSDTPALVQENESDTSVAASPVQENESDTSVASALVKEIDDLEISPEVLESEISGENINNEFHPELEVMPPNQEENVSDPKGRVSVGNDQIAIIGMSGIMPQSDSLDEFWQHLESGDDLITEFPEGRCLWKASLSGGFMKEVDKFDCRFFGISPREAETMDPQQRLFLETVWKTIEDAGYKASELSGTKTGVFAGVGGFDYLEILRSSASSMASHISTGNAHSILANRVSYFLNLHGPSEPIDTACSSSLVAIHRAVESIHSGTCEMAIAGGVNVLLNPLTFMAFSMAGMLSPDSRCKTFDKRADGYGRGEGVGAIFLKPLNKAVADGDHIYAVIKGTLENHGGRATSLTAPNARAQAELLVGVYERSQVDPSTVSYIETHGTGTTIGDPVEINGLKKGFKELYHRSGKAIPPQPHCGIGTVKTNIGHLETAAGIAGVIKVLLSLKHRKLPATVHFEEVNPYIELKDSPFYIVKDTQSWQCLKDEKGREIPRRAGVSSFGFGGANAHVILEEYTQGASLFASQDQNPQLIVLSAKTKDRLQVYAKDLIRFIEGSTVSFIDFAYTLQVGREPMEERLAVIAGSAQELVNKLLGYINNKNTKDLYTGSVENSRKKSKLWSQDEDAIEIIDRWIEKRKFSNLAELWVEGVKIDWNLLYSENKPNRIPLPTYPFARTRCWVPDLDTQNQFTPSNNSHVKTLHPLVDKVLPTINQGATFTKTLKSNELIVKDHQVGGQSILPGVGYLEMAHAAMNQIEKNHNYNISRTVWLKPMPVLNSKKDVKIFIKEEDQKLFYEIQSDDITHARGEYRKKGDNPGADIKQMSLDEIRSRCTREFDKELLYSMFKGCGISYGTYFQTLNRIWCNEEEALGLLQLPQDYEKELGEYTLHPALMDGALQTIAGLAISGAGKTNMKPVLPFSIETVEILNPLKSQCFSYIKPAGKNKYHVSILNESGHVCIQLNDISLREMGNVSLSMPEVVDEDPFEKMFSIPKWQSVPLPTKSSPMPKVADINEKRKILIIYSLESVGLVKRLSASYSEDDVVEIMLGTTTQKHSEKIYEIKTDDPLAMEGYISQLIQIDIIYFLGGIENNDMAEDDITALNMNQERGVYTLFRLIKSLSRHGFTDDSIELKVITNDVQQVSAEKKIMPFSASLHGFTKSLAKEYPKLDISCIDITYKEAESDALIQSIIAEPCNKFGETIILRNNERYFRTLESAMLPSTESTQFRKGGVYLILGGGGGIGLELSRYLSEKYQAKLVLIGRSELKAGQKEKITEIESKGGEVLYLQADATDLVGMETAIAEARTRFGSINGVFHSAIVLRDITIENMNEDSLRKVLSPKVQGSIVLHKVVQDDPIDFMLFFSSSQSFLGNHGQSNYAAGCTFKDAFAQCLNQQKSYPVKIVNWGYWGSVGIVSSEVYKRRMAAMGIKSIAPEEGMETVERVLSHDANQVVVLKAEDNMLELLGIDLKEQVEFYVESIPSIIKPVSEQVKSSLEQLEILKDQEKLPDLLRPLLELNRLIQCMLLDVFRKMGVFKKAGEKYDKERLREELKIRTGYHRLYESLLTILAKAGFIKIKENEIVTLSELEKETLYKYIADIDRTKDDIIEQFPEIKPYLLLFTKCINVYPEILTGKKRYMDVMFEKGSMNLVSDIYQGNEVIDYYNKVIAQIVKGYLSQRLEEHPDDKIKILEIGAGTGSTSGFVLDAIKDFKDNVSYLFTDISVGFTNFGEGMFGKKYPFVQFQVLDIERSPESQKFKKGSIDIIIASNVFHATKRIDNTLNRTKAYLKKNGVVIINEMTQIIDLVTMTFGLTSGWWLFEDEENRISGSPLLNPEQWTKVLSRNGYRDVQFLGLSGIPEVAQLQNIIIGESDGKVLIERPHVKKITGSNQAIASKLLEKRGVAPSLSGGRPIQKDSVTGSLQEKIENYIKEIFAEVLKLDQSELDSEKTFEVYGVDSLIGMEIIKQFEGDFGDQPSTLLFEYITIELLSEYFMENYIEELDQMFNSNGSLGEASPKKQTQENLEAGHMLGEESEEIPSIVPNPFFKEDLSLDESVIPEEDMGRIVNDLSDDEVEALLSQML